MSKWSTARAKRSPHHSCRGLAGTVTPGPGQSRLTMVSTPCAFSTLVQLHRATEASDRLDLLHSHLNLQGVPAANHPWRRQPGPVTRAADRGAVPLADKEASHQARVLRKATKRFLQSVFQTENGCTRAAW